MRKGISAFWIAILLCSIPSISQAATWEELKGEALSLYRAKHYPEAIQVAQKAITAANAEYGPTSREYAQSLADLGALYRVQSRALQREAAAIRKKLGITGSMLGIATEVFFDEVNESRPTPQHGGKAQQDAQQVAPAGAKQQRR
jgi:hypothetical protein